MLKKFVCLAFALAVLQAAISLAPADAQCGCNLGPVRQTATYTGVGSTCDAAGASWRGQTIVDAEGYCAYGPCNVSHVTTVSCYWDSSISAYRESGYALHKCNLWCP